MVDCIVHNSSRSVCSCIQNSNVRQLLAIKKRRQRRSNYFLDASVAAHLAVKRRRKVEYVHGRKVSLSLAFSQTRTLFGGPLQCVTFLRLQRLCGVQFPTCVFDPGRPEGGGGRTSQHRREAEAAALSTPNALNYPN